MQRLSVSPRSMLLILFTLLFGACVEAGKTESRAYSESRIGSETFSFVPVYEFINFRCPHCNAFRDNMRALRADYGGSISVQRIPLLRGDIDVPSARLYLLAELRGRTDEVSEALFRANFERNIDITDPGVVRKLAEEIGMPPASEIEKKQIDARLKEIQYLYKRYGVFRTPTIIIADSYIVDDGGSEEKHDSNMRSTLDRLLAE